MNATLAFQRFIETLSHRLRTPLSVVCNDLQYFDKIAPTLEASKTVASVHLTTGILQEIEQRGRGFLKCVAEKNYQLLFELIKQVLLQNDQWKVREENKNFLCLIAHCNEKIDCGEGVSIEDLYFHHFKKEVLEIFPISAACQDLNVMQKVSWEDGMIYVSFNVQ